MPRDTIADAVKMLERAPDSKAFVFGSVSTSCVVDDDQNIMQDASNSEVTPRTIMATIARGVFTTLPRQSAVTVDSTAYTVREILRAENSDLLRVWLVPS